MQVRFQMMSLCKVSEIIQLYYGCVPLRNIKLNELTPPQPNIDLLYGVGVECMAEDDPSNVCQQVDGQMSVYTDGGGLDTDVKTNVLNKIKDSMDAGEFNNAHPDIENVKFIVVVGTGIQAGSQGTVSNNPQRRLVFPFYAIAAVGGLMVIAAGVLWRRKRNRVDDGSALTDDASAVQPEESEGQVAVQSGEPKPEGDSTDLETTMDFSSVQID